MLAPAFLPPQTRVPAGSRNASLDAQRNKVIPLRHALVTLALGTQTTSLDNLTEGKSLNRLLTGAALIIALAGGAVQGAFAQSVQAVPGLESEPIIGGVGVTCYDFRGVEVRTNRMDDLGDVARAWVVSRMPVIAVDKVRMAELPDKVQLFFYFHECGHHALAHVYAPTTSSENEADCWAVKMGRKKVMFSREDVVGFAPVFAHSRGSAAGHLPGPERVNHLLACFDDPSDATDAEEPAQTITQNHSTAGGG